MDRIPAPPVSHNADGCGRMWLDTRLSPMRGSGRAVDRRLGDSSTGYAVCTVHDEVNNGAFGRGSTFRRSNANSEAGLLRYVTQHVTGASRFAER